LTVRAELSSLPGSGEVFFDRPHPPGGAAPTTD